MLALPPPAPPPPAKAAFVPTSSRYPVAPDTALHAAVKPVSFVALAQIDAGAPGAPAATATLTVCVATPCVLLAVKVNVFVAPPSATGGV